MRRALLVGIDAYKDKTIPSLQGCTADVSEMAAFLKKRAGFRSSEIRLLTNGRATTKKIEQGIRWLIRGLGRGDRGVFFYSGHGTQMPDPLPPRKAKRILDAICPHDFNFSPRHVISRIMFEKMLEKVKSAEVLLVSDSCHSGDLLPDQPDQRRKHLALRPDQEASLKVARREGRARLRFRSRPAIALFAGCRSKQTSRSAKIHGRWHGVFTYHLLAALHARSGLEKSLKKLRVQVEKAIRRARYTQRPDLDASTSTRNRPFLR